VSRAAGLPTVRVPAGSQLWRLHRKGQQALWFGPDPKSGPRNRFDAPGGEYGICYFGDSPEVCVAETIVRQPTTRVVPRARLEERAVVRVPVVRELTLVRVHGPGLVRLGIGAEVAHGDPYGVCQSLALSFWNHPEAPDGIEYRSRWDNDRFCFALFDRAADALDTPDHSLDLGEPRIFNPILRLYDIGVI
jgi:hypothetical protein